VLGYHGVSDSWPSALAIRPERLGAQVGWFLRRGYRPVTFTEAATGDRPGKHFAVTFDDAYRSVHRVALPVLARLGVPATVFVPTAFPGRPGPMSWPGIDEWAGGPWEQNLVCCSWDELRELRAAGWEIGSHTCTHARLIELGEDRLAEELSRSKRDCEAQLDLPCTSLAYPFGGVDARVVAGAERAGYTAGAAESAVLELAERDPLRWPRLCFHRRDNRLRGALKTVLFTSLAGPWNRPRAMRARESR
jgi:peptidoglycan/xylan/chitin deacetylase (PgdA/CDA1 family)